MIAELYYSLPYETRRFLYSILKKHHFRSLQKQRNIETTSGYSCKPFLENECIFVHIPKAAGVSISHALFENLGGGHETIAAYQIMFSKNEFDRFFKFTFVRNPWDRLYSAFRFLKQGGMNEMDESWSRQHLTKYQTFEEFVEKGISDPAIQHHLHFKPQYRFLTTSDNETPSVDFVGYFENIENDFNYIKKKLFLDESLCLKFENQTRINRHDVDYRAHYNERTIDIVSKIYAKDIELFGYNFDNSSLPQQFARRNHN